MEKMNEAISIERGEQENKNKSGGYVKTYQCKYCPYGICRIFQSFV